MNRNTTPRPHRTPFMAAAIIAAVALFAGPQSVTHAATWDGGAATDEFTDAANWNPDGVPGVTDTATINANNLVDFNDAGTVTIDLLRLGVSNGSASGELDVQSGSLVVSGASGDPYRDGNGTLRISGGDITFNGANYRFGHRAGSQDAIVITAGTYTNNARVDGNGTPSSTLGIDTTITASGGTMNWAGSHFDAVSAQDSADNSVRGTATMDVSGTATVNVTTTFGFRIGEGRTGGDNVVNQSGGTVNVGSFGTGKQLRLGSAGSADSTSAYNIFGGTLNVFDDLRIGDSHASVFHVTGDDADINITDRFETVSVGNTTVRFTLDDTGVSSIDAGGIVSFHADTTLEVDVDALTGANMITLFNYGSNGTTFDNVNIFEMGGALSLGADPLGDAANLAHGEYFLDYGSGSSDSIVLFYNIPTPAALPAGLAMIVTLAARRRRR